MEKKALYNALRIQGEKDFSDWRRVDWRALTPDELFAGLANLGAQLDRMNFSLLSREFDAPEEMADSFANEMTLTEEQKDLLFLHLFELWRRFVPEKQTLSLFCDELDYEISRYLNGSSEEADGLETDLATLLVMLNERVDEGYSPINLFQEIQDHTASDLEAFLYNYISDQIDLENPDYALEIVEGFKDYISDIKWFALLKARLLMQSDPEEGSSLLQKIAEETESDPDLDFQLELLTLLLNEGNYREFTRLSRAFLKRVERKEELQEFLHLLHSYYSDIQNEKLKEEVEKLLKRDVADLKLISKELSALIT